MRGYHQCHRVVPQLDDATVRARALLLVVAKRAQLAQMPTPVMPTGPISLATLPPELITKMAELVPPTYKPSAVWHECSTRKWLLASPLEWCKHVHEQQTGPPQRPPPLTGWSEGNAFLSGDRIPSPRGGFASYALISNECYRDPGIDVLECIHRGWPQGAWKAGHREPLWEPRAHAYLDKLLAVDWEQPVSAKDPNSCARRDLIGGEAAAHFHALALDLEAAGVSPSEVRILFHLS